MKIRLFGAIACLSLFCAGAASAASSSDYFHCGDIPNPKDSPVIKPIFRGNAGLNDAGFDCMAWQDFIYLNWPAAARGVPNPNAKFGAPGPTVWETYKTVGEVFLPNGANPGPWDTAHLLTALKAKNMTLAQKVASGAVRHLTQTSKVSREALASILAGNSKLPPEVLDEIAQAGGGTLYDLTGNPVYYEIAMNRSQYEYVVTNGLYNANTQAAFAKTKVIDLPPQISAKQAAIELKAAWKVLTDAEKKSGRFHAIEALIQGSTTPVTVGLVGLHMFIADGAQGAWVTFQQMDNAPAVKPATSGNFNFFNPKCTDPSTGKPCAINVKDANPGQVVQITPDDPTAVSLNTYMRKMLVAYDPNTPWQYYNLINVQWATNPVSLETLSAPASVPLPDGKPNTATMVNPVLETFEQKPGTGCFSCHQYAQTANVKGTPRYAASYSFTFERASAPAK